MKIIHFHPDARMAEKFVFPLMEAEINAGYQTTLVSSVYRPGQKIKSIPYDLLPYNLLGLPWALLTIFNYLRRERPDIVFSHNTKSSLLPLLGAWLAGVRVRVYFNHGVPCVGYKGVLSWFLRKLEVWNCRYATRLLTVSEDMRILLSSFNLAISPQIIANGSASGLDLKTFSPDRYCQTNFLETLGLSNKDLVVIYIGRPERRKGFDLVLHLWAEKMTDNHLKLLLCGPESKDVLKHLGFIPSNVISLGFIDNMPEVLSIADLMILPSLHEGLSYACMEAQASGVVVVANDISGIRCVIENEKTGYLVPKNEISKYVEIIRMIDKDRSFISRIGNAARESIDQFSRDVFMPAYLSFLREILIE